MVILAILGCLIVGSIVAFGIYHLVRRVRVKEVTDRYRTVQKVDADGTPITVVIDAEDTTWEK